MNQQVLTVSLFVITTGISFTSVGFKCISGHRCVNNNFLANKSKLYSPTFSPFTPMFAVVREKRKG